MAILHEIPTPEGGTTRLPKGRFAVAGTVERTGGWEGGTLVRQYQGVTINGVHLRHVRTVGVCDVHAGDDGVFVFAGNPGGVSTLAAELDHDGRVRHAVDVVPFERQVRYNAIPAAVFALATLFALAHGLGPLAGLGAFLTVGLGIGAIKTGFALGALRPAAGTAATLRSV